ncbi:MAG: hypothetical protein NVSMB25_14090 [Thermoleophilaceae bacterium]
MPGDNQRKDPIARSFVLLCAATALVGCGAAHRTPAPIPVAVGVGTGPRFRPPALGAAAARGLPIGALRCGSAAKRRFGAHLELFAAARVILIPAGIGIAPPRRAEGAYVSGGRCSYPTLTREPTGVIEVEPGHRRTLGDLFAVWGQPLTARRLAGFRGTVRAYVGGRLVLGDPRPIALARHTEIVLEVGPAIAPHASYRFAPGL